MTHSPGESSQTEDVSSILSQSVFPFMSLPAEIRLMIYDAFVPDQVYLSRHIASSGLHPDILALMTFKVTRNEFLPRLFSRCHFNWADTTKPPKSGARWDSFQRYAIPFITSLSLKLGHPFSGYSVGDGSPRPFRALLRWMRWRSARSHLYPWHLKRLELSEINPHQFSGQSNSEDFPKGASVVPGLESLTIKLFSKPSGHAAKTFLEQCARNGTKGKISHQQWGRLIFTDWLCLQNNQIIRTNS